MNRDDAKNSKEPQTVNELSKVSCGDFNKTDQCLNGKNVFVISSDIKQA